VFIKIINKLKYNIITLTLNPVLDKTVWIRNFEIGNTFLAERSQMLAAGKGVNISRALKNFNIESIASGILCSANKDIYLALLKEQNITNDFVFSQGIVRTNITIITNRKTDETHIRERGGEIDPSNITLIKKKMKSLYINDTFFVFAGSLPVGLPSDTYKRLIKYVNDLGAKSFLDTSGDALKEGIKSKPFFIKPNIYEAEEVLGFLPESDKAIIKAIYSFRKMGIENIMISRGKRGIIFYNGEDIISASVNVKNPVNTVGSGDASLAGAIIGITQKMDTETMARLSCAMGAANTMMSGACIFSNNEVMNLFNEVTIRKLD